MLPAASPTRSSCSAISRPRKPSRRFSRCRPTASSCESDMPDLPRVVAFDGDDTLWHNETIFSVTQDRFRALIGAHVDLPGHEIDAHLVETERQNLATYGYGIKGFVLSMVETAIAI